MQNSTLLIEISMNSKIFNLLETNLKLAFPLDRHSEIRDSIGADTVVDALPWTPARYRKFKDSVENELYLQCEFVGTVRDIVAELDVKYLSKFFGEIWRPRTDEFTHSGWDLVDKINRLDPQNVLDVGCGYHPFKGRIQNLVGIDPYNTCADYEVDVLDYKVAPGSHDVVISLGAINFNSREEVEARFAHCIDLLKTGGKFFLRANPGIPHKAGPYVDIFPWSFEVVNEFAEKYNLNLDTFKRDANDRLYFVYTKL